MTTAEAAKRVGLAPGTLLRKARVLHNRGIITLPVIRTGKRGRPGLRWTVAAARAVAKGVSA